MGAAQEAASERLLPERSVENKQDTKHISSSSKSTIPTSISIKSESQMASSTTQSSTLSPASNSFGVESLRDTIQEATCHTLEKAEEEEEEEEDSQGLRSQQDETVKKANSEELSSTSTSPNRSPYRTQNSLPNKPPLGAALLKKLPLPFDSPFLNSPASDSAPISTPRSVSLRSLRLSDDEASVDEAGSQAVASSVEDDDQQDYPEPTPIVSTDNAPQLVMPSVQMPSRRPITDRGRHLGKLKIMIAGRRRLGKTSLIKSIVQTCEDIVHVDPVDSRPSQVQISESGTIKAKPQPESSEIGSGINQVLASTRAYPSWMSELDTSRLLKRNQNSSSDVVLERNVCFIDTPGFDDQLSFPSYSASILQYIKSHLHRTASLAYLSDSELMGILGGNGGTQVDVVLYLLSAKSHDTSELELMRQISRLTNVIPLLAQTDRLDPDELSEGGAVLAEQIGSADIDIFDIRRFMPAGKTTTLEKGPLCVSSAPARDEENLDASLLMSSEYIQPLKASDMNMLSEALFDPETSACLRHKSLRKLLHWRRNTLFQSPPTSIKDLRAGRRADSFPSITPVTFHQSAVSSISATSVLEDSNIPNAVLVKKRNSSENNGSTTSRPSESSSLSTYDSPFHPNSYTVARLLGHTQREERLAQVRLARWAADLQRALRNERMRFASLKQAERTAWLQERLEECVDADEKNGEGGNIVHKSSQSLPHVQRIHSNPVDPLGLLEWRAQLSQRGVMVAKFVGGAGVLGAIVVWVMRTWGLGSDLMPEDSTFRSYGSLSNWWSIRN